MATLAAAIAAVLLVPSGCSTIPNPPCGEEPDTAVCSRLAYSCGTAVVCYSCGAAKRVSCGVCADTQTCGGGGTPHVCWPPLTDGGGEGGPDATTGEGGDAAAVTDAPAQSDADDAMSSALPGDAEAGGGDAEVGDDASMADDSSLPEDGSNDGAISDATSVSSGDASSSSGDGDDAGPSMVLCSEDALAE